VEINASMPFGRWKVFYRQQIKTIAVNGKYKPTVGDYVEVAWQSSFVLKNAMRIKVVVLES